MYVNRQPWFNHLMPIDVNMHQITFAPKLLSFKFEALESKKMPFFPQISYGINGLRWGTL